MKEIALLSITHIHSNKHSFVVILVQMRWRCKYLTSQRRNFFLIFGTFSYIYWYDVNSTICTLFIVCVCFVQFMPISSHPETGWIALFMMQTNGRAHPLPTTEKPPPFYFWCIEPTENFIGFDYGEGWGWSESMSDCVHVTILDMLCYHAFIRGWFLDGCL